MNQPERSLAHDRYENPTDRYSLHGQIGLGGMATVHLGQLAGAGNFSRTVAIKRMRPEVANNRRFVDMFLAEARVASRVRHPNVVSTLDVVSRDGELWLVMDYVHGESLARLLGDHPEEPVPLEIACAVLVQALQGLEAVHNATSEHGDPLGVVHRDVSPQNVLVDVHGMARLLDFGAAKTAVSSDIADEGMLIGKLAYMAPEQIRGEQVDRRADVFAAAVVLWEVLTGRRLFRAKNAKATARRVLAGKVPPVAKFRRGVPEELDRAVQRALTPAAEGRFVSASEFAEALARAVAPATHQQVGDFVQQRAAHALDVRSELLVEVETRSEVRAKDPSRQPERSDLGTTLLTKLGVRPGAVLIAPKVTVPKGVVLGVAAVAAVALGVITTAPSAVPDAAPVAAAAELEQGPPAPVSVAAAQESASTCEGEECEAEPVQSSDEAPADDVAAPARKLGVAPGAWSRARDEGRAHYRKGEFKLAAAAYRRASRLRPADSLAYAGLGGSLLAAGQPVAAVQAYRKAVKRAPRNARYHAALGVAQFKSGHRKLARGAFEAALQLDPKNQTATSGLKRILR